MTVKPQSINSSSVLPRLVLYDPFSSLFVQNPVPTFSTTNDVTRSQGIFNPAVTADVRDCRLRCRLRCSKSRGLHIEDSLETDMIRFSYKARTPSRGSCSVTGCTSNGVEIAMLLLMFLRLSLLKLRLSNLHSSHCKKTLFFLCVNNAVEQARRRFACGRNCRPEFTCSEFTCTCFHIARLAAGHPTMLSGRQVVPDRLGGSLIIRTLLF